ncbi:MAG: tRNA (cytidine(34)-2'-O)-methyltransferase [Halieaceae bacterium]|nr:tRNA (cytidine(34)-2'-O)-methyltransferase [Halieaceae bacterium]
MLHVVLYQPEIPPNTGNIIRLCANTDTQLSLIAPLGFDLEDRKLRRAGLDYREFAQIEVFECLDEFSYKFHPSELFAFSTHGKKLHSDAKYSNGNALLFGPETRGLPKQLLEQIGTMQTHRIPMHKDSRSINLSNAVAIVLFEALRQLQYPFLY